VGYLSNFYLDPFIRGGGFAARCWRIVRDELALRGVRSVWTHYGPDAEEDPRELRAFVALLGFRPVQGIEDDHMPALRLDLPTPGRR